MSNNIYMIDDPRDLVQRTWEISRDYQRQKFEEYERAYQDYKGWQDMSDKDPFLAYPSSPLPYSIIESQTARDVGSLFSKTPYVPLGSLLPENSNHARDLQDALQCLFDLGRFKQEMTIGAKMRRLYGLAFIEPMPFFDEVRVMETQLKEVDGVPVGTEDVERIVRRFRIAFNAFAPWEIFRDPFAKTIHDSRWVIKQTLVSKRELIRRAKLGDFGDKFDISEINSSSDAGEALNKDQGNFMRTKLGLSMPQGDPDIALLSRFESRDRYIDVLDFKTVLRDSSNSRKKNPFNHNGINLGSLVNNYDPNSAMRFDGIGELKAVESTVAMHNMLLAQLINNHAMQNHKVLLYQRGKVTPEQLIMRPGGRIEVTGLMGNAPLRSAVEELQVSPLPRDAYAMPGFFESMIRTATGVFEQDEGSQSGSQTATGDAIRRQQSDSRKGMTISMFEWELEQIARLCFSHMDQFMEQEDWGSIIGSQRAQEMQFTHPDHIPGGCTYLFKGKDRASEQLVRRRELLDMLGVLGPLPTLIAETLELHNFDQRKIEQIQQELAQIQQQQAQAQEQSQEGELQDLFAKKRVAGKAQTQNSIEKGLAEVAVGLKSLAGSDNRSPTQAKAKR